MSKNHGHFDSHEDIHYAHLLNQGVLHILQIEQITDMFVIFFIERSFSGSNSFNHVKSIVANTACPPIIGMDQNSPTLDKTPVRIAWANSGGDKL